MKAASIFLPVVVVTAVIGAYLAGQYVGRSDAERRFALVGKLLASSQSSDSLFIAGTIADLLKESKPSEALRVTEQFAGLQASALQECLSQASCSWWAAATEEHRTRLRDLVAKYGGSASASNVK